MKTEKTTQKASALIAGLKADNRKLARRYDAEIRSCQERLRALFAPFFGGEDDTAVVIHPDGDMPTAAIIVRGWCFTCSSAVYQGGKSFTDIRLCAESVMRPCDVLGKDGPQTAQLRMMRGITAFIDDPSASDKAWAELSLAAGLRRTYETAVRHNDEAIREAEG